MRGKRREKGSVSPFHIVAVVFAILMLAGSLGRFVPMAILAVVGYSIVKNLLARKSGSDSGSSFSGSGMGWTAEEARRAAAQDAARASFQSGSRSESGETYRTASRSDRVQETPAPPFQPQAREESPVRPAAPARKKPEYAPEVQKVVDQGEEARKELSRLYATIPDLEVKHKVQELLDIAGKIIDDAKADPTDVPQIQKFLDYYLPTTIKLLKSYERMSAQGISGENINRSMENIREMLDTTVDAYKKLLDSLFANQALDIETDIQVMNTLLKREGLTGGGSAFQFDVK